MNVLYAKKDQLSRQVRPLAEAFGAAFVGVAAGPADMGILKSFWGPPEHSLFESCQLSSLIRI